MPRALARRIRSVLLPPTRRWSADDARSVLTQLEASGLTVPEFAAQAGVGPQRLYRWRAELRGAQPAFVEISRVTATRPLIEVVLRSGHVLRAAEGFDEETVRRLVQVLDNRGRQC